MTAPGDTPMTITQADREAAAALITADPPITEDTVAEALAAHRIAALEEAARLVQAHKGRWGNVAERGNGRLLRVDMVLSDERARLATAIRNLAGEE